MGHEITVSAFSGMTARTSEYQGIPVVNSGDGRCGVTRLPGLAAGHDMIITLMDIWALPPGVLGGLRIPAVHWFPVDTSPLSVRDERWFRYSPGYPVAMSEHGGKMLAAAGLDGAAIPYAYDPAVFRPDDGDREKARREAGLDGKFAVGIKFAVVFGRRRRDYAVLSSQRSSEYLVCYRNSIAIDLRMPRRSCLHNHLSR